MTLLVVLVFVPVFVHAQSIIPTIVPRECRIGDVAKNCGICQLAELVRNLLNVAIFGAVIAAAVLFAWTGFKFVTARDNSGALNAAKGMFRNVFIGLIIILAAWLIVNTIMSFMVNGNLSAVGPWNKLCR